jgi:DNA invertase Pin-like site-specific DNA recombinase
MLQRHPTESVSERPQLQRVLEELRDGEDAGLVWRVQEERRTPPADPGPEL